MNHFVIKEAFKISRFSPFRLLSSTSLTSQSKQDGWDEDEPSYELKIPIPKYKPRPNESLSQMKARLIYQSRKRGMLENGILLSTFIHEYIDKLNETQLKLYDKLINKPSNDWDIYYWAIGVKPTPEEYDNDVMDMFKRHVQNVEKKFRIGQPALN